MRRIGGYSSDATPSAFQNHMDDIVQGIKDEDAAGGDGGKEMLEFLRDGFRCVHPDDDGFRSVDDYFEFRRLNVGATSV